MTVLVFSRNLSKQSSVLFAKLFLIQWVPEQLRYASS